MKRNYAGPLGNGKRILALILGLMLAGTTGCSHARVSQEDTRPSPDHPVTVVLWNYYNGQTKTAFDELVEEFNDTVGMENGIVVDAVSLGDLTQLAESVFEAAGGQVGAEQMPDIFGGYPDNVYRIDKMGRVADLDAYFTTEELGAYRQDFLNDCRMGVEEGLKMIPAARSTDVLYLNETDWNRFSGEVQADLGDLSTWEGVAETAKRYYEWSGGKTFLGMDSIANYIIISSMQLEQALYEVSGTTVKFQFSEPLARKLWENLYLPYINGYYGSFGRFGSDDAKTGDIVAYIGSSAGAQYFPMEIARTYDQMEPITSKVLPYPYFEGKSAVAIAQGAGFAVAKSDPTHEYAAAAFLKWFTAKEQNVRFSLMSGYLPVQNEALAVNLTEQARTYNAQYGETVAQSIGATRAMLDSYTFYANRSFEGSYELRQMLSSYVLEFIKNDLGRVEQTVKAGADRSAVIAELTGEEHFQKWYSGLTEQAMQILGQK